MTQFDPINDKYLQDIMQHLPYAELYAFMSSNQDLAPITTQRLLLFNHNNISTDSGEISVLTSVLRLTGLTKYTTGPTGKTGWDSLAQY